MNEAPKFEKEILPQKLLFNTYKFFESLKMGGFSNQQAATLQKEISNLLTDLTNRHFATKFEIKELEHGCITKNSIMNKIKKISSIIIKIGLIAGSFCAIIKIYNYVNWNSLHQILKIFI